jgi:pyruvate formate lyase activating enzyme
MKSFSDHSALESVASILSRYTVEGTLYEKIHDDWVRCHACGHRCKIAPGKEGICKVRFNRDGKLYVPFGYASGIQVDPIEKKPFYHVLPGSKALSFGMLGCDFHCDYCQNWITSQTLRDAESQAPIEIITAADLVDLALKSGSPIITSTYNEPLITSEWAVEVFRLARSKGLRTSYVSNGNGTPEVIEYLRPYLNFYKVDLKSFQKKNYQQFGGRLSVVLDTIASLKQKGFWIEIVTLVVPGFNDSESELREIAGFISSVSLDIPWHVTAFHPDYKMTDADFTPRKTLQHAAEIGWECGLRFVYAGNIPGMVGSLENTYCPACNELLVERTGFRVTKNRILNGGCPKCFTPVPGVWK